MNARHVDMMIAEDCYRRMEDWIKKSSIEGIIADQKEEGNHMFEKAICQGLP